MEEEPSPSGLLETQLEKAAEVLDTEGVFEELVEDMMMVEEKENDEIDEEIADEVLDEVLDGDNGDGEGEAQEEVEVDPLPPAIEEPLLQLGVSSAPPEPEVIEFAGLA